MALRKRLEEAFATTTTSSWVDPHQGVKNTVHLRLVDELGRRGESGLTAEEIERKVAGLLDHENTLLTRDDRARLIMDIVDEALGYGPIEQLIRDSAVTEVMVNGPNHVYVEQSGKLHATGVKFRDDQHVMRIIEKIVAAVGRRIDESQPYVDARLPDGSRVNAIIPPLALNGPCLTIRKFAREPYLDEDLIGFGTFTPEIRDLFSAVVRARLNVLISGGTGSGKTTLLNVVSMFIPEQDRIVTIEDAAELQLKQAHWVRLETRPPNIEGKGQIAQRDLLRNALRMRPDRILVGEVRGAEALDMLQAMNTGHEGSLTTVHANSARDALARVETMVLMAGMDLPSRAIREQMGSAFHVLIHLARYGDGTRKVAKVAEITGMEGEIITMQDLAIYTQTGVSADGKVLGQHSFTGIRPAFYERLKPLGIDLPLTIFLR